MEDRDGHEGAVFRSPSTASVQVLRIKDNLRVASDSFQAVQSVATSVRDRVVSEVHEVIRRSLRDCGRALVAKPMVAVLLKQGAPGFNSVESGLYQEMELVAEASLKAGGKDCTLWVVAPRVWPSPLREASSQALVGMEVALNASMAGWLLREECSMWPVQASTLSIATLEMQELLMLRRKDISRWRRLLNQLHMTVPTWHGVSFLGVLRDQYGPDHAFLYQWACFYVQQLWILCFVCVVALCCGVSSPDGKPSSAGGRLGWEVFKVSVCLWTVFLPLASHILVKPEVENAFTACALFDMGVEESDGSFVAVASRKREAHIEPASSSESRDWGSTSMTSTRSSLRRSNQRGAGQIEQAWCKAKVFSETTRFYDEDYNPEESWFQRLLRWAQICVCFTVIWLFFVVLLCVFMLFTMLVMYLVYSWGGCDTVDPPCTSPDGPNDRNAPLGTIAEIGCDVALAILFELFTPISLALGAWLARLGNHRYEEERDQTAEAVALVLASLERLSYLLVLATVFAPQWDPPDEGRRSDMRIDDCFSAALLLQMVHFNNAPFACIRGQLDYKDRLHFFTRLMKGPFMVAPFVSIIVKILVPVLVERLDSFSRHDRTFGCLDPVADVIVRILSFIFVFDGDSVGGLRFVCQGWPYSDLQVSGLSPQELHASAEKLDVINTSFLPKRSCLSPAGACCRKRRQEFCRHGSGARVYPSCKEQDEGNALPEHAAAPAVDEVSISSIEPGALEQKLESILQQGSRKPFEPACELLQLKTSLIMVSFFVAVMPFGPIGVFLTLLAKLIEVKALLSKMVLVRRRVFAQSDRAMRRAHQAFVVAVAAAIPAWTVILSLITFNADLYSWTASSSGISSYVWHEEPKYWVYRFCIMWFVLCAILFVSSGGHPLSKKRMSLLLVALPGVYFVLNPEAQVGRLGSA